MILGITGHRPDKVGGYKIPNPTYKSICTKIDQYFKHLQPKKIISGMALGVDQWAANVALNLGIPFVAAIPFDGFEIKWPAKSQETYLRLLNKASEVVVVSSGGYTASKLQIRNKWIVDYSNEILAIWDGSAGGTANCINYAEAVKRKIIRIDPRLTVSGTSIIVG